MSSITVPASAVQLPGVRSRRRLSCRVAVLAVAALLACAQGCARDAETRLAPLARLVEQRAALPGSPALEARRYVVLDEVARPTLAAARALPVELECAGGTGLAPALCGIRIPAEAAAAPWLLIEVTLAPEPGKSARRVERHLLRTPAAGTIALARAFARARVRRVDVRALPALAARDVTTEPLDVAAGSHLRFAVGIEPPADRDDTAPVVLEVTALAGPGERLLYRRALDPARVEADRRWIEEEVALDAVAGRGVRLRFTARPVDPSDARPSLPVWGDPTVWGPAADEGRPSIVLVSLDTLRARSTSAYGNQRDTTPYLTELARQSVLFERAFTTFSNTLGSHMSMMTGLYPASHGVVALDRTLADAHRTLAEVLRAVGYDTAAFTEDGLLEGSLGFQRGFGLYAENKGVYSAAGDAPGTFARALAWARGRAQRPFFLFVHTYAVHLPYEPPPAYAHLFADDVAAETRSTVEVQRLRYEQEIRALDDELRKLLGGLEEVVPAGRLLLVVTADHGEEFGEHGQLTHLQLFDEVLQVPLIVRQPAQDRGRRVAEPVSLIDILPTVVDLAGADALPGDGVSLAPALRGTSAGPGRTTVFAQSLPYDLTGKQWRFIARTATEKCILPEAGNGDCYDLTADPDERHPLAPASSVSLAGLHEAAAAYRASARATITAAGAQPLAAGADDADEARRQKLRALGYVD